MHTYYIYVYIHIYIYISNFAQAYNSEWLPISWTSHLTLIMSLSLSGNGLAQIAGESNSSLQPLTATILSLVLVAGLFRMYVPCRRHSKSPGLQALVLDACGDVGTMDDKLAEYKFAEDKLDDKLTEDKLAEDKLAEDRLAGGKLIDNKLTDDKLAEDKLAEDKLAEDMLADRIRGKRAGSESWNKSTITPAKQLAEDKLAVEVVDFDIEPDVLSCSDSCYSVDLDQPDQQNQLQLSKAQLHRRRKTARKNNAMPLSPRTRQAALVQSIFDIVAKIKLKDPDWGKGIYLQEIIEPVAKRHRRQQADVYACIDELVEEGHFTREGWCLFEPSLETVHESDSDADSVQPVEDGTVSVVNGMLLQALREAFAHLVPTDGWAKLCDIVEYATEKCYEETGTDEDGEHECELVINEWLKLQVVCLSSEGTLCLVRPLTEYLPDVAYRQ